MPKNWGNLKDEIHQLYVVEKRPLPEVMRLVRGEHNFIASERSYKNRLRDWGFGKYNTQRCPHTTAREQKTPEKLSPNRVPAIISSTTIPDVLEPSWTPFQLPDVSVHSQPYSNSSESWLLGTAAEIAARTSHTYDSFDGSQPTLIPRSRIEQSNLNAQDSNGRSQLQKAAIDDSFFETRTLPTNGGEPGWKGQLGSSSLHMAVKFEPLLKLLLENKPSLDCQDDNGDTPLHLAISQVEPSSVIRLLLEAGANVNLSNNEGITPFHLLVRQPRSLCVLKHLSMFFNCRPDTRLRFPDGRLPFEVFLERFDDDWVSERSHVGMLRIVFNLFVDAGADVDTEMRHGDLLSHRYFRRYYSTLNWNFDLAKLFCENCDPNKIDQRGDSLLNLLAEYALLRDVPIVTLMKILIVRGANPRQTNQQGETALMILLKGPKWGLQSEVVAATETLITGGIDPFKRELRGDLPIYAAVRNFPAEAKKLGNLLLLPGSKCGAQAIGEDEADDEGIAWPDRPWWESWVVTTTRICPEMEQWIKARDSLFASRHYLPSDIDTAVYSIAISKLAELFLERAEAQVEVEPREKLRSLVAFIFRDIRALKLECDLKHYDFLLDLCF